MNPCNRNIRLDCKLEYNWRDIQEAQKIGFEDCKRKVLEILKKHNVRVPDTNTTVIFNNDGRWYFGKIDIFEEIENLK